MRTILTLAALGGFAYGARHFYNFLQEKRKNVQVAERLEVWENEGGTPEVPANVATLSPRGVS